MACQAITPVPIATAIQLRNVFINSLKQLDEVRWTCYQNTVQLYVTGFGFHAYEKGFLKAKGARVRVAARRNERSAGTLIDDLEIEEASQMLLSTLIGMNMLIKVRGSNEAGSSIAPGTWKTIMSWWTTA